MKKYSTICTLIILGLLFSGLVITGCGGGSDSYVSGGTGTSTVTPVPSGRLWTYMVYMGADNNLSPAGLNDLNEMETVGSTSRVAIVVQAEFSPDYSTGVTNETLRFYVEQDSDPTEPDLSAGQSIGNVDMGSPEALTDFIKWATQNYPAQNYALILWDHGDGWREIHLKNGIFRGAIEDETSGSFMSLPDLAKGVEDSGVTMSIVNFDACLMAMYEVAYEFKGLTNYMVFSEETEPGNGDPYDTILADLVANPTMNSATLAATMVNRYDEFYTDARVGTTLSAVDMSKLDNLDTKVRALSVALSNSGENTAISNAQSECQSYYETSFRDLYDFCACLKNEMSDTVSINAATEVQTAINQMVIANQINSTTSTNLDNSYGLAIYIPNSSETTSSEISAYGNLACNQTRASASGTWGAFVESFVGSGGGGSAEYGAGEFEIRIEWAGDSDVDLWVREPDTDGGTDDFASGYTGQSTPNGSFSPDSYESGNTVEYYQADSQIYTGNYYFAVTYYEDGASSTSAEVNAYYRDPQNGINTWHLIDTQTINSSYTTTSPWWIPVHYSVSTSASSFVNGTISSKDKARAIVNLEDKK